MMHGGRIGGRLFSFVIGGVRALREAEAALGTESELYSESGYGVESELVGESAMGIESELAGGAAFGVIAP